MAVHSVDLLEGSAFADDRLIPATEFLQTMAELFWPPPQRHR